MGDYRELLIASVIWFGGLFFWSYALISFPVFEVLPAIVKIILLIPLTILTLLAFVITLETFRRLIAKCKSTGPRN